MGTAITVQNSYELRISGVARLVHFLYMLKWLFEMERVGILANTDKFANNAELQQDIGVHFLQFLCLIVGFIGIVIGSYGLYTATVLHAFLAIGTRVYRIALATQFRSDICSIIPIIVQIHILLVSLGAVGSYWAFLWAEARRELPPQISIFRRWSNFRSPDAYNAKESARGHPSETGTPELPIFMDYTDKSPRLV